MKRDAPTPRAAADKELIVALGANPRRFVAGSLEVRGRDVSWAERCRPRSNCLHARSRYADRDAIEAWIEAQP